MKPDKKLHAAAGLAIALTLSALQWLTSTYAITVQIGNLPVQGYAFPLIAVLVAAIGREVYKPPFSIADVFATMLGGMVGSAGFYSVVFYGGWL